MTIWNMWCDKLYRSADCEIDSTTFTHLRKWACPKSEDTLQDRQATCYIVFLGFIERLFPMYPKCTAFVDRTHWSPSLPSTCSWKSVRSRAFCLVRPTSLLPGLILFQLIPLTCVWCNWTNAEITFSCMDGNTRTNFKVSNRNITTTNMWVEIN